jgi:hypothetical protein
MALTEIRRSIAVPAMGLGAGSAGAVAFGAFAFGAFAMGAVAVSALAIGRLSIGRLRLRDATIDRLYIRSLELEAAEGGQAQTTE